MLCEYCERPIRRGDHPWCSTRCHRALLAELPRVAVECPNCKIRFFVPETWNLVPGFCSLSCSRSSYNRKHFRGSDNPRWKGGRALSYGSGWKAIKSKVRARDRVCRSCGKTSEENGRALDVHQLVPFRFSGDNSMENLVALCRSCHMRADDHGRAGSARFLHNAAPKRPTKREIRRLKQLIREAEKRALRCHHQREALRMNEEGASLREIARSLGISHQTVYNWIRGIHRVEEPSARYHTKRHRRRALGRPLLSCPSLRPGSSVGRARV